MLLKNLIKNLPPKLKKLKIKGLASNSKEVRKGFIFFALKGIKFNGEHYIDKAIKNGAILIICSKNCKFRSTKVKIFKTKQVKSHLSEITSKFYIEGQVSGVWTKINSSFLQGNKGNIYSGNILAGLNYYFKANMPMVYFNFLAGLNYSNERIARAKNYEIIDLGISTGLFLKLKKLSIGLGLESPQNIFLKFGFNLK